MEPTPTVEKVIEYEEGSLPVERGKYFVGSGACAVCHTKMVDESGTDVSTDTFWRSTMMANASRDPYWQASIRAEALRHPDYQAIIEDRCATCHMPMARFNLAAEGGQGKVLDDGFLDPQNEHHSLAMDGISCTLCHQIEAESFGQAESFSGGYVINADLPAGERLNYGPFTPPEGQAQVMQGASGFIPVQGSHIQESEMCATCHTLYTPYVDSQRQIAGEFPEQMSYFEWSHSDYKETNTCQGCHMPPAQSNVRLSVTGGPPRSPVAQHHFSGSNVYMSRLIRAFGEELKVTASSKQLEARAERTIEHLQTRTATLALENPSLSESRLEVAVAIKSQVGHKFPTGFPSRRAWLRFTVRDADGKVIFESGSVSPEGVIRGNDNDADPASYEPHYVEIASPDQVQIYEAIMRDTEGEVTTTLLKGAAYLKDNRLLPAGFDKNPAEEDIAVQGEASKDDDFQGGEDRVRYTIEVGEVQGPLDVTVELLYQSIGYRWTENLRDGYGDAPEIARFLEYYQAVPNLPVVVASATVKAE